MNGLDIIENSIKLLIEKSTIYFPWSEKSFEIMSRLNDSIQDILINHPTSPDNLPYRFSVKMNSTNVQVWQKNPTWQEDLSAAYNAILKEYGIKREFAPVFVLVEKKSLEDKVILFEEIVDTTSHGETNAINAKNTQLIPLPTENPSPILLFGEGKEIKLAASVITIGRRRSNDIIIDDMRISRIHAQIRRVPDGFMLFDAGSSGGTFINGTRVTQHHLNSGDVISLGGYKFIYLDDGNQNPLPKNLTSNTEIEASGL